MHKQSTFVIALLIGASSAARRAPKDYKYFADGMDYNADDFNAEQIAGDLDPEQVSVLETPKATAHTTYYGQQQKPKDIVNLQGEDLGPDTEKVHVLNEEYFRHRNDNFDSITNYPDNQGRTTFYAQLEDDEKKPKLLPEQVSVLETPKATAHSTYYAQKNKKDIGENGIEENVHEFATDAISNPLKHVRKEDQYAPNGSAANGWGNGNAFAQTSEEPAKLLPEQVSVLETPKATAHTTFYGQKDKKIEPVSENNIDPWVETFSNENMSGIASNHNSEGPASRAQFRNYAADSVNPDGMDEGVFGFVHGALSNPLPRYK